MPLPTWRKVLVRLIYGTLALLTIIFWDSMISAVCIMTFIGSLPIYAFNRYGDMDMAQQFDNGKNTEGWK